MAKTWARIKVYPIGPALTFVNFHADFRRVLNVIFPSVLEDEHASYVATYE